MKRLLTSLTAVMVVIVTALAADLSRYIPSEPPVHRGYNDIDSVKAALASRQLSPVEGLWTIGGNQAVIVIEPATSPADLSQPGITAYRVVLVSSVRKALRPGTVLGYLAPDGHADTFDALIYTSGIGSLLSGTEHYTATLTADGAHLNLSSDKPRLRLTLRHTFKLLLRATVSGSVRPSDGDRQSTEAFTKLYPPPPGRPSRPVYL
ncbi:MAG: hypothetical protein K2N28_08750 [Muribaculaceae bacterium]|nr:hypothetical protein [Muribaculaceae bacterium]